MPTSLNPPVSKVFSPVDPGIAGIAVTSAAKNYSGAHRQGRQASPSPPAQQTAKEADSRRKAKTESAFGQGGPFRHPHQSPNPEADRPGTPDARSTAIVLE